MLETVKEVWEWGDAPHYLGEPRRRYIEDIPLSQREGVQDSPRKP